MEADGPRRCIGGAIFPGGSVVEVDLEREPEEGEVLVFTPGGGFSIKGTIAEIVRRFAVEEWPEFELSESGGRVCIRSSQVVALRGGTRPKRSTIGFVSAG